MMSVFYFSGQGGMRKKGRQVCPECGSTNLIYDSERGEIVCGTCGLVLSDFQVQAGAKEKKPSTWDFLGIKTTKGVRLSSKERTELAVATRIEMLAEKLNFPPMLRNDAILEGRKLLNYLRKTKCVRLTCAEISLVAVWIASRKAAFPLTMRELAEAAGLRRNEIYPLLNRVSKHISLPKTRPTRKDYLLRALSKVKIRGEQYGIPERYVNQLEHKALSLLQQAMSIPEAKKELSRRSPVLVAVAMIYLADELLEKRIISKKIQVDDKKVLLLNFLADGGPSVPALARTIKRLLKGKL
ncbi:MAG TPA: transcription initiation factor IIB family protein [Thermococcus sp.]|nr:transcription initiation factor IIB family protein [Thermococcus sp.]